MYSANNEIDNSFCTDQCAIPFKNHTIINQRKWQKEQPGPRGMIAASGHFKIGDNFITNTEGVNNYTGRGYYANPNGYWNQANPQFTKALLHNNLDIGALYPNVKELSNSPPQIKTVFGYAKIGEVYRTY